MTEAKTIELQIDDVVDDRYRICRRLGRGGMGTVYEAQQIKLQRQVALKVLRPEFAQKELAAKRFEREAKSASSIDHRNVVKILDFGHLPSGELYYTMELMQGRDLSQELREQGALPWSRAGWIILQVVRAFAAIHDKGIVHRDIKPANCFLLDPKPGDEPDFVKILDFGIANLQDQNKATALTAASDIIGSVYYMAPEQAASDHVDARTDIYSLGIMMYELLTGKVPFRDPNVFKVMLQHQTEPPRSPRELVPEIPPEVEAIILRCIAKEPADRFQSMAEIEAELLLFVDIPMGSGVVPRSSSSASVSGSHAGRPLLQTRPGPTGTIAVSTSARTRVDGPAAETSPRVGGSMPFMAQTYGEPQRRRGMLLPLVLVLLVFGGAIGLTLWLKQRSTPGDELASADVPADDERAGKGGDATEPDDAPLRLAPPPETPYDPFADPFGAPPLRGRTVLRPSTAAADGGDVPMEEVPLEEILPAESWTLEPGSIAGRILGEKERPVAKAQVCAWIVDPRAPLELRRRPKCANADRQGRFEIREVPPSLYDISAFARGFSPQSLLARDGQPLAVQPEQRSGGIELVLVPGGAEIRGTVKTTVGDPIASASVALVGSVRALAVTNAAGEFSLWGAEAEGDVAVVAWANGYSDVVKKGRASEPFGLVLRRESILMGKVVDPETREPIAKARVRAGAQSGGLDPLVYSDAEGLFRITSLPEGTYLPTARTDVSYGQAKKAVKLVESTLSPEVLIEARRVVVEAPPKPPEPPEPVAQAGSTGDAADTDATAGTDGTTEGSGDTDGTDGDDGTGDVGEAPAVASNEAAPPTAGVGSAGEGKGAAAPTTPAPAPAPAKPAPTNQSIRKAAAGKLKKCGVDGQIELTAAYVLADGSLFKPKVTVTGEAAKDPKVRACAEKVAKGLKLLRRNEPTSFERLVVKL